MNNWRHCKRILCIRLDNMGDLLMSSPAIRALKETFGSHITVLTSSMAAPMAACIPVIDETLVFDAPWVKNNAHDPSGAFHNMVQQLKSLHFDAAVIFTVYSQNPLPAVMLAYLADIPLRLAYCRENPYALLTHWMPEKEPYRFIRHQVQRDLDLVKLVGAVTPQEQLSLRVNRERWPEIRRRLAQAGIDLQRPLVIVHTGVSDNKRRYPADKWIAAGKALLSAMDVQLLLTGTNTEKETTLRIQAGIGQGAFSIAGWFDLPDFITLIHHSALVISVNTGTIHIAAATGTPVLVLYALTNPQHTPWKAPNKVLYFDVPAHLRSRNEVIQHVYNRFSKAPLPQATTANILEAAAALLQEQHPVTPRAV